MIGFASALIARTHGADPMPLGMIQPRVPALYAPAADGTAAIELEEQVAAPPPSHRFPSRAQHEPPPVQPSTPMIGTAPAVDDRNIQPLLRIETRETVREHEPHHILAEPVAPRVEWRTMTQQVPVILPHREPIVTAPEPVRVVADVPAKQDRPREKEPAEPRAASRVPARSEVLPLTAALPAPMAAAIERPREAASFPSRRITRTAESARPVALKAPVPDIQIHIGRIEIRSESPVPSAPRRAQPQPMSLEEYSRRRQGESR